MSLITDLLSKVKQPGHKRDVPPLLKDAVRQAASAGKGKGRLTIPLIVAAIIAAGGVGAFFLADFLSTSGPAIRSTGKAIHPPPGAALAPAAPVPPIPEPVPVPAAEKMPPPPTVKPEPERAVTATPAQLKAPGKRIARKASPVIAPAEKEAIREKASSAEKPLSRVDTEETAVQDKNLYLHTAKTHEKQGNYPLALADYGKVLAIDPGNYTVMNNMAGVYLRRGALDEAARYAEKALSFKADYLPALINLGIAYSQTGKDDAGEACLRKALSLEPSHRLALLNMGLLQEKKNVDDQALEYYTRLSQTGDTQGYLGLARLAEKQGRTSDAIRYYRTAMSLENRESKWWLFANERLWQLLR